jgi:hypothetical protein
MRDELLDERIRSAVPRQGDSDWRDVRRRARRKAAPAILAAAAIVTVLLAAPAFALRHQIADLWASAEPEKNLYVTAVADCGHGTFTLEFDPDRDAIVLQDGQMLAHASLNDRQIDCDAPIHELKATPDESPWHGDLEGTSSVATTVTCQTDVDLQIGVNPVWFGDEIVGSSLLVADRYTKRLIASAGFKRDPTTDTRYSDTYWDTKVCSARE